MRTLRALFIRVYNTFRRRDAAVDEELASHLAMHIDDNVRAGMTPEAARREALLKLGGLLQAREAYRDRRGLPFLDHLAQDLRFALRTLRKSPGFTSIVVITLGLGIGANAAMFSIINAVMLRPFAFSHPDRVVIIWPTNEAATCQRECEASWPRFEDWRAQAQGFDGLAAFSQYGATVADGDHAERFAGIQMTPEFFDIVGATPALGRTFQPGDEAPGVGVAILSDAAWRLDFGARADIIGRTIRLNERPHTIVGVMRPEFDFTSVADQREIYTPLTPNSDRRRENLMIVGLLRPGVSIRQAQADMDVITRRLASQYPETDARVGASIVPYMYTRIGKFRIRLWIVMGVVAVVLLIACTNVANLLLARNAARARELGVRVALGAGRARLLQQLLTESLVLVIGGGALGLLLASWLGPALAAILAARFPIARLDRTHVDAAVFAFTFGVSMLTAVLFGVMHAHATIAGRDLHESLRGAGRGVSEGPRGTRLRRLLVVTQVALALVLLAGAGSLLRSLMVLRGTPSGLATDHVLAADFALPRAKFADQAVRARYFQDLVARVRAMPEVRQAAIVSELPFSNALWTINFRLAGPGAGARINEAKANIVSADYFATLQIPVKAGRVIESRDTVNAAPVAVINEAAARRFWPDTNPVGQQIVPVPDSEGQAAATTATAVPLTVVGVTGDVRQMGFGEDVRPEFFVSCLQPASRIALMNTLIVRSRIDPASLALPLKTIAGHVDPDVPFTRLRPMEAIVAKTLAPARVYTSLLAMFAALALLLATIGLYGVMSYTVSQRTPELAIRMALGAHRRDIVRLVVGQALTLTLTGTALGLTTAFAADRLVTNLVPTAEPSNPTTLTAVAFLLIAAASLASLAPALRGSRVDPISTIRAAD